MREKQHKPPQDAMQNKPNSRATAGAVVAVLLLLLAGVWVFNKLDASQKAQECAERRGTKCAVINEDALPRR